MDNLNLLEELFEYAEKNKTSKLYKWLNEDNLNNIILDDKVYWFELTSSSSELPDDLYNEIKDWIKENYPDLIYLYDIPVKY